jgi:hypothetical protein
MKRRLLLVSVLLVLLVPAVAEASTFCVGPVSCPPGGIPKAGNAAGLQSALDDAELNNQPDRALIAAGIYEAPTAQGFSYSDAEELDVTGSGRGSTIIRGSAAAGSVALNLSASGAASVVANLTVRVGAGSGIGRGLDLQNATASGVSVDATPGAVNTSTGVAMDGNAVFESSSVEPAPAIFRGVDAIAANNTVRDCSVDAPVAVQAALAGAEIAVSRCRLTTSLVGVGVGGNGASGEVSNSLIGVTDSANQEDGLRAYSGGELAASNVTLMGSGNPTAGAVAQQTVAGVASLSVESSVVRGFANSFRATQSGGGSAGAIVSWSSWDTPPSQSGGASVMQGAGNLAPALDPRLVNAAAGDYRLRFDSPLVDAASPGPGVGPDLAGLPRYVDGAAPFTGPRRDMGAFEYQRSVPDAVAAGPGAGTVGESLAFAAQGSSDPDPGEALTYLWSFDDGTTATGVGATHAWSSPGPHTATLTATDPTGQSDSATVVVHVSAAGGAPGDAIAPQLTDARMARKRFRVGGRPTARSAARAGSAFLFTLSESATVRIRIERAAAGRRSAGRCVKPRRRLAQARRCRRYVLVGTLTRRELAAGRQRVAFSGRLGKRRLAAGRYRALLSATDAAGNRGQPAKLAFRIVRR